MKDISKRLGKFQISKELIMFNPKEVLKVMSEVIVIRCECHFQGYLEYLAFSERFDVVEEGVEAPMYTVVSENGQISYVKM